MTLVLRSFVRAADAGRLGDLDLIAVAAGEVAALATRADVAPAASEAELRAHEALTRRIHDETASLPARFGVVYEEETDLASALAERAPELLRALAAVDGRVEMGVTLAWRRPRVGTERRPAASGRAYLEARAEREREREEAEQVAARFVAGLGYERAFTRESICPRVGVAATVALLIPRTEVMRLRQYVASFRERSSEVTLAAYGPVAPYSFAS